LGLNQVSISIGKVNKFKKPWNDYKGSIEEFQRTIGLSPTSSFSVDAANYMDSAHLKLNDIKNAIKAYKTGIKL